MFNRLISFFVALIFVLGITSPVYGAYDIGFYDGGDDAGGLITPIGYVSTEFIDMAISHLEDVNEDVQGTINNGYQFVRSLIQDDYCPDSTNHRHNFIPMHTQVGNDISNFYACEYCRKTAGEVMDTAYTDYVETLPAQTIGSDGYLYYSPEPKVFHCQERNLYSSTLQLYSCNYGYQQSIDGGTVRFANNILLISGNNDNRLVFGNSNYNYITFNFTAPIEGTYNRKVSPYYSMKIQSVANGSYTTETGNYTSASVGYKSAGANISSSCELSFMAGTNFHWAQGTIYNPVFTILPLKSPLARC